MEKITSRRNSKCLHIRNLGKSRDYRYEHGEFVCDGEKLLGEALKSGMEIVSLFTESAPVVSLPSDTSVYLLDRDIIDSLSPLKNSQNLLFVCKVPKNDNIDFGRGTHILLDRVQDPGNIGTVIRSADAFGIDSVILTEGSADPYSPKAVRASMGAVFRQRVCFADEMRLSNMKARFVGTGCGADYTPVCNYKANLDDAIIVLGNEGQGISPKLRALCGDMITIPLSPRAESLNVAIAASIIMWEARK